MILTFKLILILSIWILGLTIITQPNMLLYKWRVWAEKKKDNGWQIMENGLLCHWCMGSIHFIFAYAIATGIGIITRFEWSLVFILPIVVAGSSIVCGITWSAYQMISAITEYFKNLNNG